MLVISAFFGDRNMFVNQTGPPIISSEEFFFSWVEAGYVACLVVCLLAFKRLPAMVKVQHCIRLGVTGGRM